MTVDNNQIDNKETEGVTDDHQALRDEYGSLLPAHVLDYVIGRCPNPGSMLKNYDPSELIHIANNDLRDSVLPGEVEETVNKLGKSQDGTDCPKEMAKGQLAGAQLTLDTGSGNFDPLADNEVEVPSTASTGPSQNQGRNV